MAEIAPRRGVANSLVALGSAAVIAVYSAGYFATKSAADQLVRQAAERPPVVPAPEQPPAPVAEAKPDAPVASSKSAAPAPQARPFAAPVAASQPRTSGVPAANTSSSEPSQTTEAAEPLPNDPPIAVEEKTPEAPLGAVPAQPLLYTDGTYYGWGTSRHGDIQAAVVIEGGRIASATIAQCLTRYSCSVIEALPPQVAARQSADVDHVSGATQSADAFYYAVTEALSKAR